ncbi:CKLF-like MARVEL transmembrane domain-containing protein 5 isoform X2 [Suricata suricatta]|uniref:CKLF-like MARVEL transmembrane domain-containing protein 5 isoform X2 n=1 Tax=Suricata suricatta TaxID=37032 RepID=UPI001155DFD7|nr:CKLF-like MARVEL transmembrane domain-containing protein 5 isoform X2 [Suricata suricatta]
MNQVVVFLVMAMGTHTLSIRIKKDCIQWSSCCPSKGQEPTHEWLMQNTVLMTPPETTSLIQNPESCRASEDGPLNSRSISPWRYEFLVFPVPFLGWWQWGLCQRGPTEMLSARDHRDRPPEEGAAAVLQGFAVDKTFLSSLKGILLETELALTFIIFICFTASISAYMAAALLEFFITLAFLFLYATQYYQRFDRLNWPCLVFGIILVSVFAYDAFKIYRTEMAPRTTQGPAQGNSAHFLWSH